MLGKRSIIMCFVFIKSSANCAGDNDMELNNPEECKTFLYLPERWEHGTPAGTISLSIELSGFSQK